MVFSSTEAVLSGFLFLSLSISLVYSVMAKFKFGKKMGYALCAVYAGFIVTVVAIQFVDFDWDV